MNAILINAVQLMAILVAPFVAFAVIIHWLEYVTSRRLASRFGWNAVLWTGWLGTPVHELSHVLACRLFGHRLDEVALFEPDRQSGRLGFVRHSYHEGNRFQEAGNFFIGIAPLIGGSVVLALLLWMFYPEAFGAAFRAHAQEPASPLGHLRAVTAEVAPLILDAGQLLSPRFWLFVYLVLCVGGHMAPSPSDYQGARRGLFWVLGGLLLVSVGFSLLGTDPGSLMEGMLSLLGPLFAVLGLAVVLCGLGTALVWLLTAWVPIKYAL